MKKDSRFAMNMDWKYDSVTLLIMVAMCFLYAISINGFYVGNNFLSGGVTGIAYLFEYTLGIPGFLGVILLNIPVTIVGILFLDMKTSLFSAFGTAVLSLALVITRPLINFTAAEPLDPMVSAIIGGAIVGITSAPVVKRNATLGGMDVISMILTKKYSISMGVINIIINLIIMATLGVVKSIQLGIAAGMQLALFSIIAMFVCNMAFNAALRGLNRTHTVFIISDEWDDIAPEIMKEMHRGVTYIPAEGAYSGLPKKVVYCIVKTVELSKIKKIVMNHDPKAMFSIIDTQEVVGRGFGSLN